MPLTVEDGTIVTDADSYITVDEYKTWADNRYGGARATAPSRDEDVERNIYRAMDYFEQEEFKGSKKQSDQSLQFPRQNLIIDGYTISSSSIPKEVKVSIFELTYAEESGRGALNPIEREESMVKVGPLTIEYDDNASSRSIVPGQYRSLRKLLKSGGGLAVNRV